MPVACCRETLLQHWSHRMRGGEVLAQDKTGVEWFYYEQFNEFDIRVEGVSPPTRPN
jgi:hypothetical protein